MRLRTCSPPRHNEAIVLRDVLMRK
jgi:hypothetical protein